MEDSKIDMIFAGNFDRLERVKHPIIRVYLSSTYTDMTMEKSILVTEVYPKVKEYCRERYGAEFQVGFSDPHLQFVNKDEWMNYISDYNANFISSFDFQFFGQVIDMRWGVRDEATDDHQTMTICRDEVKFSTGFSRLLCKVTWFLIAIYQFMI